MTAANTATLWAGGLVAAFVLLVLLRKPFGMLLRFALRGTAGLGVLSLLGRWGVLAGLGLGVNWFNAAVLGILGSPGLGLLLMLMWVAER